MKYFAGSFLTILSFFIAIKFMPGPIVSKTKYRYSQAGIHVIIKPLLPRMQKPIKKTQSRNHEEKTNVKVIILDGKAYWIRENRFYVADMDGEFVDKESAQVVDTISMDGVQLEKMLFIMDRLRDGKENDSGNSRN
jgi:hypothetical protein